ncbi:MAG: hypothetical protein VX764_07640 [Planctomycetota bacterium]|nr:hypothetical protein [Planctomycetota bacterium]
MIRVFRISEAFNCCALLVALLMGHSLPGQWSAAPAGQISRTSTGDIEFSVQLPDAPAVVPALPDLSRAGVYELPGGLILKAPLPVIWHNTLIPPGKHSISIEVGRRLNVSFLVQSLAGGPPMRIAVRRGILDRPGERILATLATVEQGKESQLLFQLRWGVLLLSCTGIPVPLERQELEHWVLNTYQFPDQFSVPVYCVLGVIENRKGDEPLRRLVFTSESDEQPQLRLEDPSRERTAAAREELLRSLRRSQMRLRRIEGGAVSEPGEEETLRKRIDRALQQRAALDTKLATLDGVDGAEVLLPLGEVGAAISGLQVRLEKKPQGVILTVQSARGGYHYLLASGS